MILDLSMPYMDGERCFQELRQLKHDARVILSSGYNEQEMLSRFAGKGLAGYIQKPYRMERLRKVLQSVLK